MSVPASHLHRLVAHQVLHCSQINPSHDKTTGERVPQVVPGKLLQSTLTHRWLEPVTRPKQSLPGCARENVTLATGTLVQSLKGSDRIGIERNVTRLPILAPHNCDLPSNKVHVSPLESVLLAPSHTCMQRDVELGQVTSVLGLHSQSKALLFIIRILVQEAHSAIVFPFPVQKGGWIWANNLTVINREAIDKRQHG